MITIRLTHAAKLLTLKPETWLATLWIYCASHTCMLAQEEVVSRHYLMRDGLSEQGINSVMQDRQGFIWLGTYSGFAKFDGYTFTTFRNNPASVNSVSSNLVKSIREDRNGRLWIGHLKGIDLFDPKTEQFYLRWNHASIERLRLRKDGMVWICTNNGVYVGDPETKNIEKVTTIPDDQAYFDIAETSDGSLWAAGGKRLIHFDAKTRQYASYVHDNNDPNSLASSFSWSLFVDEEDRVWIGTNDGLELFNPHDKSFTHFLPNARIPAMTGEGAGKILIGAFSTTEGSENRTAFSGLYSFDTKTGELQKRITTDWLPEILVDKQGIIWLATLNGLQQINPNIKKFRTNLAFGKTIGPILAEANGKLWMLVIERGTQKSSLFSFSSTFKDIVQYHPKPSDLDSGRIIKSISSDNEGAIWFISDNKLEKYDPESTTITVTPMPDTGAREIISSFIDSFGNIWLGEFNGLTKYHPTERIRRQVDRSHAGIVYSFLEDTFKNLWIGSTAGLTRYNLKTGKLDIFKNDPADSQSVSSNTVFHLMIDTDKNIWVGTDGGLNKMMKGTENYLPRFQNWSTSSSDLPNDDVYCIVDGGDHTLWLTCGNMISHFDPRDNTFRNYDQSDGLSGKNFRGSRYLSGKGIRSRDGYVFFGSSEGLVVFHPDSLQSNPFIPSVVLTGFSLHNSRAPIEGTPGDTLKSKTPLHRSISYTDSVRLSHDQNDFDFEFAALNFINQEENQYRYRLEPYEKEWITTTSAHRVARYTNISPGTYVFRVMGSNDDGVWNEEGVSLFITIAPPWWQTWWAYALYGLLFIALTLSWRGYDIKRVKLKHRAEHLSEVDQLKSRFFTNISHEFRTPITLILGPLKDLYNGKSKEDLKVILDPVIRNGERLHRLINQLLDLSKLEAGKMKLHTSPVDVVAFLRAIAASYESTAADKRIKYNLIAETESLTVYLDEEKMEKVVYNLLSNAFKFTEAGGEVIMNVRRENNNCLISVRDSGIGIPSDQLEKVFDRFYQVESTHIRSYEGSGLGMALTKELVDLHKGEIWATSTEGKGSTFSVMLPLGRDHLSVDQISDTFCISERESPPHVVIEANSEESTGRSLRDVNPAALAVTRPLVLIIDDNADLRKYMQRTLSEEYHIVEAENGNAGLRLVEETLPDLIISDIMMPEMDGYKLCSLVKSNQLTSHIPIILLTAKADRESKLVGLKIGVDDYLPKPFDSDELRLIVRNRIDERRKMRDRFSREVTLEPKQISITSLDEKFITKVLAIIESHMGDEHFSIDELSHEAGFSNMHFYRKIKALSGQTPSHFLRTMRLKRAAQMLAKNSDNVTQIAYSVGFGSLSYFNKCFKEQFGTTPGQFSQGSQPKAL